MTNSTIIQNRIEAQNQLATFINKVVPLLQSYLLTSGFKIKVSGQFYEKNDKEIRAILDTCLQSSSRLRAYIECSYGNIKLNADINYSTGDHGCAYIKEYPYLYDCGKSSLCDFKPRKTDYSVQAYEDGLRRIKELEQEIDFLKDDISSVKRDIGI
jgi:hypothetical protein